MVKVYCISNIVKSVSLVLLHHGLSEMGGKEVISKRKGNDECDDWAQDVEAFSRRAFGMMSKAYCLSEDKKMRLRISVSVVFWNRLETCGRH